MGSMRPPGFLAISWLTLHLTRVIAFSGEVQARPYSELDGVLETKPLIVREIPGPLISLGEEGENSSILLVEKATQRLYLYKGYNLIRTFQVTTGRRPGDKREIGDQTTPEGAYFFTGVKGGKELPQEYGIIALILNYPNHLDAIHGKNGYGIWLHGTDQPTRPLKPFDTRGCVVMANEDIVELARYISLQTTPIVVVDKLEYLALDRVEGEAANIKQFLKAWKEHWEGKRLTEYMDCYSRRFRHKGMDWEGWKRYKDELNHRYTTVEVSLKDIKILSQGDYVVASFVQDYRNDRFKDVGIKRLYLVKEGESWRILGEEWATLPNQKLARVIRGISPPRIVRAVNTPPHQTKVKRDDERDTSPVGIEDFQVEGGKGLKIRFRLVNKKGEHQKISGRLAIVASNGDADKPLYDTYPSMGLRKGIPRDFRRGEWFSTRRFKIVQGEMKKEGEFKNVKVFVYSTTGRLLLEREFSIDQEKTLLGGVDEGKDSDHNIF